MAFFSSTCSSPTAERTLTSLSGPLNSSIINKYVEFEDKGAHWSPGKDSHLLVWLHQACPPHPYAYLLCGEMVNLMQHCRDSL